MAIKLITDKILWDGFVDESPAGLLYHKWEFLKIIEKHTKYELFPFGVYKGETLICIFPMFFKRIWGVKCLFSPPPQSGVPYLGPVLDKYIDGYKQHKKENLLHIIVKDIDDGIKKIGPNYFFSSLVPNFPDIREFRWFNYDVNMKFTYTLDLKQELSDIWNNFDSKCRKNIHKGESLNCKMLKTQDSSMLIDLQRERYKKQNMNYLIASDYLDELVRAYPENLGIYCLYGNDQVAAIALYHEYKRFMAWMGTVKSEDSKYRNANEYILWRSIEQAKLQGYKKYEIVGANKANLCRYKSKFNPQLEPCFEISRKDFIGKFAEGIYLNFIKRRLSGI